MVRGFLENQDEKKKKKRRKQSLKNRGERRGAFYDE